MSRTVGGAHQELRALVALLVALVLVVAAGGLSARAAGQPGAAPLRHSLIQRNADGTSSTWAGYVAAASSTYTQVSASWTQPAVTCGSTETSYASFWVGLDGAASGDGTVEQTGTDSDCASGSPTYYAWYEMYPQAPVTVDHTVQPGDALSASVTESPGGQFTLTVADSTEGWSSSTPETLASAMLQTAEVVAEAPSESSGVLPLADFGTVSFTASVVNNAALGDANPASIEMESGGTVKAVPSSLSDGGSFSVTWQHS